MTSGRRKKLLSSDDLDRGAREIADLTRNGGPRVAAVGGYAMQIYGSDRLTSDLDIASDSPVRGLPRIASLSFGGYSTKTPSGVPTDVILRDDEFEELYDDAVSHARRVSGVPIRVALPEHLVSMKMIAGRPKDDLDLMFLLGSMTEQDRKRALRVARRFLGPFGQRELAALILEADWRKTRQI